LPRTWWPELVCCRKGQQPSRGPFIPSVSESASLHPTSFNQKKKKRQNTFLFSETFTNRNAPGAPTTDDRGPPVSQQPRNTITSTLVPPPDKTPVKTRRRPRGTGADQRLHPCLLAGSVPAIAAARLGSATTSQQPPRNPSGIFLATSHRPMPTGLWRSTLYQTLLRTTQSHQRMRHCPWPRPACNCGSVCSEPRLNVAAVRTTMVSAGGQISVNGLLPGVRRPPSPGRKTARPLAKPANLAAHKKSPGCPACTKRRQHGTTTRSRGPGPG